MKKEVDMAKPWEAGGCRVVTLPWIDHGHYFLLVAVLDVQPILYILESLGNYPEPVGTGVLRQFLVERRLQCGGPLVDFDTVTPVVPKQEPGSNDCGVFLMEMATLITMNPEVFIYEAASNSLSDWFCRTSLRGRRQEMASLLKSLGEEQRSPGGVLENEGALVLPDL